MRHILLLLLSPIFLTSCAFFAGQTPSWNALTWGGKYVALDSQGDRVIFLKTEVPRPGRISDMPIFCVEPPPDAPRIRHVSFELCQSYANEAISGVEYRDLFENAVAVERTSALTDAAFGAIARSDISQERSEQILHLIYDLYGTELASPEVSSPDLEPAHR